MKKRSMDLTQGPVAKQLLLYTYPIFISQLLQTLYSTADQIVAGRFSGSNALAAIGATTYSVNLLIALVTGLATGANVLIANFRGGRNLTDTRKAVHASLVLSLIGGLGISLVGFLLSKTILLWTGTPAGELLEQATQYMRIRFVGIPFAMIYNFGSAILRAHGDTKRPMLIVSISGIVNVVLNLIFVIFFHMGADGVAWATAASQAITAFWILWILMDPKDEYRVTLQELKLYRNIGSAIVRIGIPISISSVLLNLSGVFLQSSINSFGPAVMAGSTASDSLSNIIAVVISSFFQGSVTFAGQCYGAGKYQRMDQLHRWAHVLSCGSVTLIALLYTLFPRFLLSLVNTDPAVIDAGVPKLLYVAWGYVFQGSAQVALGINRGMQKSFGPTCISLFSLCLSRLLWIWFVFPFFPSIHVLYFCLPMSMVLNAIGHNTYYFICRKKLLKRSLAQ